MNIIVRPNGDRDLEAINYLNSIQPDFKLNSIDNAIIDAIAYDGNVAVCYGIVKRVAEAVLLANFKSSRMIRARAMRELMLFAESAAAKDGIEQIQCFVTDEHLAKLLEKQFKFIRAKDIVLVKNLSSHHV